MVLQPIGQNAQVQRLTTALKNICRDYPAGGTVLRELLQNADDAGATEVRFILDERSHLCDELINPHLKQYQGPALLAYNNAVFTDTDFLNLSRLGDSLKLHDGSTTGKFGRGFNSVYNWTDSPSILSRERLLILDPHCEWSGGGPVYDFVDNYDEPAIQSQMAAFGTVMDHLDQQLEGTVIRIPLRTEAQALKSEISSRGTSAAEVLEVLQSFASEFGDNGLLFMKNVEKLEIGAGDLTIEIKMADRKGLRPHKSKVNEAVKCALVDSEYSFDHSFEAGIEYRSNGESRKTTFIVHHSMQSGLMDGSLRDWAKDQKLIPWVAVAAQLPIQTSEMVKGALFTVLPLPILTSQPVLIHGLFSISPDRARLYQLDDKSTQDRDPAKWNNWLLKESIPMAWTRLLSYLASVYPHQPAFEKWPQSLDDTRDPISSALEKVMGFIEKESLALWPTVVGYLTAQNALLGTGTESMALRNALREARAPIVFVPERLQQRSKTLFQDRLLSPQNLCHFMKTIDGQISSWSDRTKLEILEYLLSEPGFVDYGGLELFPFKDGIYRSVGASIAFVARDKLEEDLFSLEDFRNLDIEKLSKAAARALKRGCESSTTHSSIRYRSARCLRQYCMHTVFKNAPKDRDEIVLNESAATIVTKVWTWISTYGNDILDKEFFSLWLLPLSNGHYRRVKPEKESNSVVYFALVGELGDHMRKFDAEISVKPLPLLDTGPTGLAPDFLSLLTRSESVMSSLLIKDASNIVSLLEWLHRTYPLIDHILKEEDRLLIAGLLVSHFPKILTSLEREIVVGALSSLAIFQKVLWKGESDKMKPVLEWTRLDSCTKSIGLLEGISPVPVIDGVQFLIASWSSSSKQLLEKLELADCLGSVQLVQDYIIPAWESGKDENWAPCCKEQLSAFTLTRFSSLPLEFQHRLRIIPMIPVSQLNGKSTLKFAIAADLIDPNIPELKELCFSDEEIIPKEDFLLNFHAALTGAGLKTMLDEGLVENRVRCYASNKYPIMSVEKRSQKLLESTCRWAMTLGSHDAKSNLRRLNWIPAVNLNGDLSLNASNECRGLRSRLLVSSGLPIFQTHISTEWEMRLGWCNILPGDLLLSQIRFGIERKDREIIDAVLTYISNKGLIESMVTSLESLPCVLVTYGSFVIPSQAFRPPSRSIAGCERLQPYLANIDNKFWQDHRDLLIGLGVGDNVGPSDLLKVQRILEEKSVLGESVLGESDLAVAIEMVDLASKIPRTCLEGIKVVCKNGEFHLIEDVYFDDLGPFQSKEKVNLTHPDIPKRAIDRLGIGGLRERLIKGMLEIEDFVDEDEFDQRENVTTRIADTLVRYPIETTFREYLANADDVKGASKISWVLDPRVHPSDRLLTPQMDTFQGPAFLVYNDGVFDDDDFQGFKNVGEGSKAHDPETIGQFGRGAQTMYHWTDVPMVLSGRYLLILDPQQEVLPRNRINGVHKPGVKLELSKLRSACGDQLTPFEGVWGYTQDLDNYPGTIFRFPLPNNTASSASALRTCKRDLNSGEICRLMDAYFREARISLLFLRRIKSIDFGIYGRPDFGWSVARQLPVDEDFKSFSELVVCHFTKNTDVGTLITGKDKWWVAIEDVIPPANRLPDNSRRAMKNVECGLAAFIETKIDKSDFNIMPSKATESRMFNTLPLSMPSSLPVHIHATFLLSGDRQSISMDEYFVKSTGSTWNKYLLQEALPNLYLSFLEDIQTQVRQRVFAFWPQTAPPKSSPAELLYASFWKKLPQSSQRLFPKAQLTQGVSLRKAAERFDISQAVLDFFPKRDSNIIAPLLMALGVNLVRDIPAEIVKHLKAVPEVKSVSGPMLRLLLKSDESRDCLLREMASNPRILDVIFSEAIPADAELKDLDGCNLLPLADGSLATLKFADTTDLLKYYVVTDKELKLFGFASKNLVTTTSGAKLKSVLESGKFNLAKLQLSDVRKLLDMKPAVSTPIDEEDKWLTEFWTYWNTNIDSSLSSSNLDFVTHDVKVMGARQDGIRIYASPADFHRLPAVVEPSTVEHQQLCDKIPGLYRFNAMFMPKSLMDEEDCFSREKSFRRLIHAIQILSNQAEVGVEAFVKTHLDLTNLKVLRDLLISHVSNQILSRKSDCFPSFIADLKSISLWPKFHTKTPMDFISASKAMISPDARLLVPWMKDRSRFVDAQFSSDSRHQDCLLKLGVTKLPIVALLMDYVQPLPRTLDANYWECFQPLISALVEYVSKEEYSNVFIPLLRQSNIAADGHCKVQNARELYDHDEEIFMAAFRHQEDRRFLHKDVRRYRSFWLKVGLRHRVQSFVNPRDYLQCLQVMKLRLGVAEDILADPHLEDDFRIVLSPLTAPNSNTQRFNAPDWEAVSQEKVFLSRTDFNGEPEYRQATMAAVAAKQRLLPLLQVIAHDHVSVCWSQISFVRHQPTKEIFNKVSGNGQPNIEMVWRHLQHMKNVVQYLNRHQVQAFLSDLALTYEYLQDRLNESKAGFHLGNSSVWLNIDTWDHENVLLNDIKMSWHGIEELVLSSSVDAGSIKAVRSGLMRFEKLLRALDCPSITYPTVTRPTLHASTSLANLLRQQRNEGKLVDITYSTEGRLIQAHKVVLGAMSEKCAVQFSGRWKSEDLIKYDDNDDPDDFISYHTLSTMIKHAYEEEIDWKEMQVSDGDDVEERAAKLDLLLDLHKGADCWMIPALKSEVEGKMLDAGKAFINLDNVVEIRERAELAGAKAFERLCAEFIQSNQHVVDKAHLGKLGKGT